MRGELDDGEPILLALILLEEGGLPGDDLLLTATFVAVALSVVAHGVSAAPLSRQYAEWVDARARPGAAPVETLETTEVPWRHAAGQHTSG